jgi:hypothetical protein
MSEAPTMHHLYFVKFVKLWFGPRICLFLLTVSYVFGENMHDAVLLLEWSIIMSDLLMLFRSPLHLLLSNCLFL